MRQIFLSPEFQVFKPFFVILVLIFLVSLSFLILKIVQVRNEVKSRKLLEKIFNETENGGNAMSKLDGKAIFEQALQGITPVGASGNQTALVQFLANATQGFTSQATGTVQKIQQLTMVRATSEAMRTGEQIIESVNSHIQAAQGQFDQETPHYVADALGNTTHSDQNNLSAPVAEPQADATPQANVDTPGETLPETLVEQEEDFVRKLIVSEFRGYFAQYFTGSGKAVNIDNGYHFSEISKELFTAIYGHFNGMKGNGDKYKRAYDFLHQVKTERNGA